MIDSEDLSENVEVSLAKGVASLHSISLEKVRQELSVSDRLWTHWQQWVSDESVWPEHTAFIHRNLHAGHILNDEEQRVTGLIAYGQAGGIVCPKMKEHILRLAAAYPNDIAEFAIKSGIEEYLEMAKAALQEEKI